MKIAYTQAGVPVADVSGAKVHGVSSSLALTTALCVYDAVGAVLGWVDPHYLRWLSPEEVQDVMRINQKPAVSAAAKSAVSAATESEFGPYAAAALKRHMTITIEHVQSDDKPWVLDNVFTELARRERGLSVGRFPKSFSLFGNRITIDADSTYVAASLADLVHLPSDPVEHEGCVERKTSGAAESTEEASTENVDYEVAAKAVGLTPMPDDCNTSSFEPEVITIIGVDLAKTKFREAMERHIAIEKIIGNDTAAIEQLLQEVINIKAEVDALKEKHK